MNDNKKTTQRNNYFLTSTPIRNKDINIPTHQRVSSKADFGTNLYDLPEGCEEIPGLKDFLVNKVIKPIEELCKKNSVVLNDVQSQLKDLIKAIQINAYNAYGNSVKLHNAYNDLEFTLKQLNIKFNSKNASLTELNDVLKEATKKLKNTEQELNNAKLKLKEAEKELNELKETNDKIKTEAASKNKEKEDKISQLTKEVNEAKSQAENAQQENSEQKEKISKLEGEAKKTNETISKLEGELKDTKAELEKTQQLNKEQGNQISQLTKEVNEAKSQLKKENTEKEEKISTLEKKVEEKEKTIKKQEEELNNLKETNETKENELNELKKTNEKTGKELNETKAELEKEKKEFENKQNKAAKMFLLSSVYTNAPARKFSLIYFFAWVFSWLSSGCQNYVDRIRTIRTLNQKFDTLRASGNLQSNDVNFTENAGNKLINNNGTEDHINEIFNILDDFLPKLEGELFDKYAFIYWNMLDLHEHYTEKIYEKLNQANSILNQSQTTLNMLKRRLEESKNKNTISDNGEKSIKYNNNCEKPFSKTDGCSIKK